MMGQQPRVESLFYYFRLEDQISEDHLLRLIDRYGKYTELPGKLQRGINAMFVALLGTYLVLRRWKENPATTKRQIGLYQRAVRSGDAPSFSIVDGHPCGTWHKG